MLNPTKYINGGYMRPKIDKKAKEKESNIIINYNSSVTLTNKPTGTWVNGKPVPKKSNNYNSFGLSTEKVGGFFTQNPRPKLKKSDEIIPKIEISQVLALVHGIKIQFSNIRLLDGFLRSAYARLGPEGYYGSRPSDRNGGGALAVYTRAVGIKGAKTYILGKGGVGTGEGTVLFVIKPDILLDPNHIWLASGSDLLGRLPGTTYSDGLKSFGKWEQQSEYARNIAFNESITGNFIVHNEQMHWECLPLTGLRAVIAYKKLPYAKVEALLQAVASFNKAKNMTVPVIFATRGDNLYDTLNKNNLIKSDTKCLI